ncbi:DUF4399 domain-containing protein [Trichocoleus sp. DQ-A3]|uniref:DUF6130 family protein n=1 Tax=Cyanophyceae TaxID=3028117 RepID=UPI0018EF70D8
MFSLSHETDDFQQRENSMIKLKKVHYKTKARTLGIFVLLSGLFIALFAATLLLTTPDRVLAHQSIQPSAQTQDVTEVSARNIRGASPYVAIKNEPAPKLIVDPPLPEGLVQGVYWAQYRVENLHIVPVFGTSALQVSPRAGHLHIIVDDLPWWWADASDNNTVDIAGLPPGQHKVKIQLVNTNHNVFPGQVVTQTFTVPDYNSTHAH